MATDDPSQRLDRTHTAPLKDSDRKSVQRSIDSSQGVHKALEMIDDANAVFAQIIDEAKAEAEAHVKLAAAQGHKEGFSQAAHMREEIAGLEQRMLDEVEGEIVRTALQVAARLITKELAHRPEAVVDIAVGALQNASGAREISLRVHPKSAPLLRAQERRLVDALNMANAVQIREDRNVEPGGVLVQTESGVIDATVDTQLSEIARILGA
jgi:type III secretion protein L